MVNGEDLVDPVKKTTLNKFGNESNYLNVPLLKLEKSLSSDVANILSPGLDYEDTVDYPVFVSKESAVLMKKRTTKEDKYVNSKIKQEVSQVSDDK